MVFGQLEAYDYLPIFLSLFFLKDLEPMTFVITCVYLLDIIISIPRTIWIIEPRCN